MNRFTGMLMVGYSWGQMMMLAVPPDEFWGLNLRYLNYLIPFVTALGKLILFIIHLSKEVIKFFKRMSFYVLVV